VSLSCFDTAPIHLQRDSAGAATHDGDHAHVELEDADHLHSHQTVVLDWFLLSRARWLTSVTRTKRACNFVKNNNIGNKEVHNPGHSFFGWAHALSGLKAGRPAGWDHPSCSCGIRDVAIST
jgi:hypothetical protein